MPLVEMGQKVKQDDPSQAVLETLVARVTMEHQACLVLREKVV